MCVIGVDWDYVKKKNIRGKFYPVRVYIMGVKRNKENLWKLLLFLFGSGW